MTMSKQSCSGLLDVPTQTDWFFPEEYLRLPSNAFIYHAKQKNHGWLAKFEHPPCSSTMNYTYKKNDIFRSK